MRYIAKNIIPVLLLFSSVFTAGAQKAYSVRDIPNTRLRDASSYVSNPDGILTAATVSQVNGILSGLYNNSGVEVAVVVLGSISSDSPEDFAVDLFRSWGIGQKGKDNGLLILLVTTDRFVRFEVGYGLEGDLPDAIAKRIQTVRMLPYLREGDWNGAILEGVKAVDEYLSDPDSELRHEEAYASPQSYGNIVARLIFIFGGMAGIVLLALFAQRRSRRCPRCGATMKVTGSRETRLSNNVKMVTTTLVCPKCGYTMTKNTRHNIQGGGGVFPGPFGGGSFGGGMGGGSWGGGRSGGGGATTRF